MLKLYLHSKHTICLFYIYLIGGGDGPVRIEVGLPRPKLPISAAAEHNLTLK